jgi:hypothetical protein
MEGCKKVPAGTSRNLEMLKNFQSMLKNFNPRFLENQGFLGVRRPDAS